MDLDKVRELLKNPNIEVEELRWHTKASELYVEVTFSFPKEKYAWTGFVPYHYRRTGLFLETEEELAQYLESIYPYFSKANIETWVKTERGHWGAELDGKEVTRPFFDKLSNMEWNSVKYDLPKNPNWARRVQDIKELGYTIATDTNRKVKNKNENDTHLMLLPIPRGLQTGYEVFSKECRLRILKALGNVNAYELSSANKSGLLPDHKFPEIRWDDQTREENPETMSEEEIRAKFQLLDNQRNQQKREVCRRCFQTGKRGTMFGVNFFYVGNEDWPADTPKVGKDAEKGCVGCAWYDVAVWRAELNKRLQR